MMIASPQPPLSADEYLILEAQSQTKHEYLNGEVYSMAGASDTHVTIALNVATLLRSHLRGSGCRVYITDMKVRLDDRNCFFYPDVMVTCDPRDRDMPTYKRFPKLIVEVLSDSTEAFDRGDKFDHYQSLATLEEYVLINTRHQRVECFRRTGDRCWALQTYTPDTQTVDLPSVGLTVAIADLYEDVVLEPTIDPVEWKLTE